MMQRMLRIQFSFFCFQPEIFSFSVSISFISSLNRRVPSLAYKARRAIVAIKVALVSNNIRKDVKLAPRVVQRYKIGSDKLLEYMDMTTGLSASDLRSVFLQFAGALAFFLTEGSEVQTPIGAIKLSVHCPGIEAEGPGPDRAQKISEDDMRLMIRGSRSFLNRLRLGGSDPTRHRKPSPLHPGRYGTGRFYHPRFGIRGGDEDGRVQPYREHLRRRQDTRPGGRRVQARSQDPPQRQGDPSRAVREDDRDLSR